MRARTRALALLGSALVVLGGCQGDLLDPGGEITGPVITLAPQTVAVTIEQRREVELGGGIRVTVAANTGTGTSGVARIGATGLILDAQRAVVAVVPLGSREFPQPQSGTVVEQFLLQPAPPHVDIAALPQTLTYEVHGWAISGGGACVAAVTQAAQRLPCGDAEGQPVSQALRGEPVTVTVIAPHGVVLTVQPTQQVELGGSLGVTVTANTGAGMNGIASIGATVLVRRPQGALVEVVPLGPVNFPQPQAGTVMQEFRLAPDPRHVNLNALPDSLTYEVHAWAISGDQVCVASVAETGQRLPCDRQNGHPVARGTTGRTLRVTILPPHSVELQASVPQRMEPHEVMTFRVTARTRAELGDIRQVGVSAWVRAGAGAPVGVALAARDVAGQAEVTEQFTLTFQQLVQLLPAGFVLPPDRTLTLEPSAYALHQTGACVAAVQNGPQQLPCAVIGGVRIAGAGAGAPLATIIGVEGRTVPLPTAVTEVGDLVVHTPTQRLFLSNRGGHTLEVLNLNDLAAGFSPNPVRVGSRPWGMDISADGNSLIVANSGGTNVSLVPLATLQEQRIPIPRLLLHEIEVTTDTVTEQSTVTVRYFNYTDRPQHVAQDLVGRILYSAASSEVAPLGTLRVLERHPEGPWGARFLFPSGSLAGTPPPENRAVTAAANVTAIANLDSVSLIFAEVNGERFFTGNYVLFDHRAQFPIGHPNRVIRSDTLPFPGAFADIRAKGSDVIFYQGYRWNIPESIAMGDTTWLAASGDRRWVAIGEGVTQPAGRVTLWGAEGGGLSRVDDMRDILNNTSDRITAIDLNHNGTLGIARGQRGVYFFDRFLRLQGTGGTALQTGGGVGFLPGDRPLAQQLVFLGTGRNSIQVLEPVHYRIIGEVPIRGVVSGPLRVAPCAPGAPGDCVATVYGITPEGLITVNVREAHLQR